MNEFLNTYIATAVEFITNPLLVILVGIYLYKVAKIDSKTMRIPNKLNLSFFIVGIVLITLKGILLGNGLSGLTEGLFGAIIGFLVLFIPAFALNTPMGGDIKCFTTLGLYFGARGLLMFGIILCVMVLVTKLSKIIFSKGNFFYKQIQYQSIKKDKFPMGPWFFRSYLVIILLGIANYV